MEEALALERSLPEWPLDDGPDVQSSATSSLVGGRRPRAGALPRALQRAARARNDPAGEADALWYLGFLEWRAGNWEEADRYAADCVGPLDAARPR